VIEMRRLSEEIKVVEGVVTQVISVAASASGTLEGSTVDAKDFGDAVVFLDAGAFTGAGTLDVKLQESADGTTWTDISGAAFTQLTGAGHQELSLKLDKDRKRYIRGYFTFTDTSGAANDVPVALTFVLGKAILEPV
jgi:hypothetical protein